MDVNDTFDDDEADPEYNVLADEEEQTGTVLFCVSSLSCRPYEFYRIYKKNVLKGNMIFTKWKRKFQNGR